jgi:hypothetical protein
MSNIQREIKELEAKLPKPEETYEKKYLNRFEKYATYMGGGVYQWQGLYASDTRVLWLKGILALEGIWREEDEEE